MHDMPNLEDIDAVLASMITQADAERPFAGHEAVAVLAIIELSRAGRSGRARKLMLRLLSLRS